MDRVGIQSTQPQRGPEYAEVNYYLRHYSSLRFVMVSVYFAVSAAVVSAAFRLISPPTALPDGAVIAFRVIGFGVTCAFFAYEWRLEALIRYYQERARYLEGILGYETMKERPKSNLMFRATRGLYIMFGTLWLVSLVLFGVI